MVHDRLGPPSGSRVIVVGGCGGIGRSYVEGLLAADCRVAVMDLPASLQAAPVPEGVMAVAADASREGEMQAAFEQVVTRFGGLDVLAHVAGINPRQARVEDIDFADYERVMQVNLRSAVLAGQLALPAMKAGGGAMVFVSSGLAANPEPTFGAYSISKAGIVALAKTSRPASSRRSRWVAWPPPATLRDPCCSSPVRPRPT
ncbi:MAG: SDR family oxidoreductase [Rhizobiales bacterium]|nr:SDR family oxidoreductase [Hyphomicrobiales bacterium]